MRVTSAIFALELPNNKIQGTGIASVQELVQAADQGESKTFISLYSGKASMGQIDMLANGSHRAIKRPEACFAISIVVRIDCARDEYLVDPDVSN